MKKICMSLLILSVGFMASGCEKKDPNRGRIIPVGQNYKMQVWTSQEGNAIDALTKEFISASNAAGLTINVIAFPSEEILQATLLDQMAEGKGPDVVFTSGDWIDKNRNKLAPLIQTEGFTADRFSATFVASAGETMVQNDEIYGVPMAVDSLAIIYNEDHLITRLLDRNSPGSTWQEFRQDVETLTREDNSLSRFAVSGAAIGRIDNLNYGSEILENIMMQMGTTFFTPDGTAAGFASSVGVTPNGSRRNHGEESVNFFTSFAKPQFKNYSWNESLSDKNQAGRDFNTFIEGKTSMVFGRSRDVSRIKQLIADRTNRSNLISADTIKVDFFPQFADQSNVSTTTVKANVLGFVVPATAQQQELSWNFLKFLAKKDIASSFNTATKLPTARLDLIVEQSSDPELGFFVRQAKFAKNNFLPIDSSDFTDQLALVVEEIVAKSINSSLPLLKNLEGTMTQNLKEYLSLRQVIDRPINRAPAATNAS